ncbi:MAG: hypothetical protein M5U34_44340 [Chloroflexi bacterium]|nr:hypothetical protein [Chloroflexota bacterium]
MRPNQLSTMWNRPARISHPGDGLPGAESQHIQYLVHQAAFLIEEQEHQADGYR